MKIQITNHDIRYSEKILLPNDVCFNEKRKKFIKNLNTIDLQAVPGSGKTTSLLAKILILEKYLPFKEGSGILVISHTNAAIDEVKKRIGNYCSRLFVYPNFVGTIQSFVDKFLAIPFYANLYKRKPYRIDNNFYNDKVYIPKDARGWIYNNPYNKDKVLYKSRLDENDELTIGFNSSEKFPLKNKTSPTYMAILKMKQILREKGILCFDEAYILAMRYLKKYPLIKHLLQRRFRYVFVDEMQDMDKHQYELLESIFYDKGNSESIYQRIGDKNQAIFSSEKVKLENIWNREGRDTLNIDGSCRFSKEIADVVRCFALNKQNIEGKSTYKSIKPNLLIYFDGTIKNVLPKFAEIIKAKQDNGEIPNKIEKNIKAIGWRKKSDEKNKITIKNYFPAFDEFIKHDKIDYFNLRGYLFNIKNNAKSNCLREIENNILNALLKILSYEEINDSNGRYYTKRRLLNFLKEQYIDSYQEMKLKLFLWCRDIYIGNANKTYEEIKEYVTEFLSNVFGKDRIISKDTIAFINNGNSIEHRQREDAIEKQLVKNSNNIFKYDNFNIEVGTIHSIKGETHSATLYMETFYENDSRTKGKYISYESQRLKEFFKGNFVTGNEKNRVKQSLKMAYVGMSRPKYLLCVAVHYDHVKDYLHEIPNDKWEKVEVK